MDPEVAIMVPAKKPVVTIDISSSSEGHGALAVKREVDDDAASKDRAAERKKDDAAPAGRVKLTRKKADAAPAGRVKLTRKKDDAAPAGGVKLTRRGKIYYGSAY